MPLEGGDPCGLRHLRGSYDFGAALGFAVEVGTVADREWHHPDLTVSWGHVEVVIYTHKIDGLHRSDFVLAAKMDARYGVWARGCAIVCGGVDI